MYCILRVSIKFSSIRICTNVHGMCPYNNMNIVDTVNAIDMVFYPLKMVLFMYIDRYK